MLSITIFEIFYAFGALLIACEVCQRVNIAFEECGDMVVQFEWYLFPIDIQRMLPLILNYMQQPIEIKCFGSVTCDRETFKFVRIMKNLLHFSSWSTEFHNEISNWFSFFRLSRRPSRILLFCVNFISESKSMDEVDLAVHVYLMHIESSLKIHIDVFERMLY